MNACVYRRAYACMHVRIHMHAHMRACTRAHAHAHTHAHTHAHKHAHMHARMHAHLVCSRPDPVGDRCEVRGRTFRMIAHEDVVVCGLLVVVEGVVTYAWVDRICM